MKVRIDKPRPQVLDASDLLDMPSGTTALDANGTPVVVAVGQAGTKRLVCITDSQTWVRTVRDLEPNGPYALHPMKLESAQ